jgi:hypothetical protein
VNTRDLDLTPHGPTGVSTFVQHQERENLAAAALFGGVAFALANGLSATCSVAGVLFVMLPCVINLITFFLTFAVAAYFTFTRRSLELALGSDILWTVDPQYVPTIDGSLASNLLASAPQNSKYITSSSLKRATGYLPKGGHLKKLFKKPQYAITIIEDTINLHL